MTAFFAGGYEWIIILVVALLLFGHRIPGMARSLGSGIVEFKKGLKGDKGDADKQVPPPPSPPNEQASNPQSSGPQAGS